jgi:glycosyltransferase involved in cell wall biosynthesis
MAVVTVVMPVHNALPHLPAAVESILVQKFADFDFLIIDDGSTDGSWEYLNGLHDSRIRLERCEHLGLQAVLNRSLDMVQTQLYGRMDGDDIAMPQRLERQCAFMAEHPEVVLLGSRVNYLTGDRVMCGPQVSMDHVQIVRDLLSGAAAIRDPTCVMRTQVLREIGGYRLAYSGDHDLFLRMSERGLVANLSEPLLIYRMHLSSTFATNLERFITYKQYSIDCYRARRETLPEPTIAEFIEFSSNAGIIRRVLRSMDAWSAFQYRQALINLGEGHVAQARMRLFAAALCRPSDTWRRVTSSFYSVFA